MNKKKSIKSLGKFFLLFIGFTLISIYVLIAQDPDETIFGNGNDKVVIHSKVLDEDRVMSIYLPNFYNLTSRKYPVLYLLDGRSNFQHTKGAVNFLSSRGEIPPMIIVSIHNVDRGRDFSPAHEKRISTSGGAEKFLNFVSKELIPYINKNYLTSSFSVLTGHSLGGTLATYSLLTKSEIFDAYIAISPNLNFADNYTVKMAKEMLRSNYDTQKYFYMTVGDEPNYFPALEEFSSLIKEKSSENIDFEYNKIESENHGTIPYISVYKGLKFVFSDWRVPETKFREGLAAIDEHYKKTSAKYGIKIKTSENIINRLGYDYLRNKDIESAIKVFTENVKRHSHSPNVYDSLGEAYETNEQLKLAKKNYRKAYELGKKLNDINAPIYEKNLKRVQQEE